tara:strand:+ start:86 stop:1330 length:1245 start_codon:yes stop_codon:yes gene_type:complete
MFGFGIQLNKLKQFKGLLNRYVGATAAYSLRKLSSTYYGPVVEVRRSADDAEADFTAVEVANGTLLAWVNQDEVTHTSDFSAGVDGWTTDNGTSVGAVPSPTAEGNDALRFTVNTTSSTNKRIYKNGLLAGAVRRRAVGEIYIPSGQNSIDGVRVQWGLDTTLNFPTPPLGEWFEFDVVTETTSGFLMLLALENGSILVHDPSGTDVFYLRNVVVTEITTSDGHVTTWYDQSGNTNHATQATPASQPKIVDAGVLNSDGIYFDGTDDELNSPSIAFGDNPNTIFTLVKSNDLAPDSYFLSLGDLRNLMWYQSGTRKIYAGGSISGGTMSPNQELWSAFFDNPNNTGTLHVNGTQDASGDIGPYVVGTNTIRIGASAGTAPHDGWFKEIIIYNSDQSASRVAIEGNIASHYDITI